MAPMTEESIKRKVKAGEAMKGSKREVNKGAWTAEEDHKLAEVIEVHGAKRWKTIASKAGIYHNLYRLQINKMKQNSFITLHLSMIKELKVS